MRAGQQAPFASQLCSLLLSRKIEENPFNAPLLFIICVDSHKWELIMAERDWEMRCDESLLMLLGMQDAALMAENMVIAAESLGMGSCFLGGMPFHSKDIDQAVQTAKEGIPDGRVGHGLPGRKPSDADRAIQWNLCCSSMNILNSVRS